MASLPPPRAASLPLAFLSRDLGAQELSRRKSLLAWEDGEGAASDPVESPVEGGNDLGADACPEEEEPHLSAGYVVYIGRGCSSLLSSVLFLDGFAPSVKC